MSENKSMGIVITLCAVLCTIEKDRPKVLVLRKDKERIFFLPSGFFLPESHRSLEAGLKRWAEEQTGIRLDYLEQLYTFGNRFRSPEAENRGDRLLTVSYMALTRPSKLESDLHAEWIDWYHFFPWEDHRTGRPPVLNEISRLLKEWSDSADNREENEERRQRIELAFGNGLWNPELVLSRYELLYEAGLVGEAERDWNAYEEQQRTELPISRNPGQSCFTIISGDTPLAQDHRRILASAVGRLRGKIKYRPLIFELLPPEFTLFQIQKSVEALSGVSLHKQNFRRLLISSGLVRETEHYDRSSTGRPAQLFTFRASARMERSSLELRYPLKRGARSKSG